MDEVVDSTSDSRVINNNVRHQYRVLSDAEKAQMLKIKDLGVDFLNYLDEISATGREFSLARTKIEEAVMWAVKGITN